MAKTCWKCCCRIWADTFDSGIATVTVVDGTAAHDTDHLELTAAGTLVLSTATSSSAVYFNSVLRCADSNEVFWVIVDAVDEDNYHALKIEFRYSGDTTRIRLYKVTSGTPTALGTAVETSAGTHIDAGDTFIAQVCLTNTGLIIGTLQSGGTSTYATTTRHSGGNKVGYLLETATTLEVDNVDWQTEQSDRATCPTCGVFCSACQGEFEVTIAGLADDTGCASCDELNQTFIVPALCGCFWLLELGETDVCDNNAEDGTHNLCGLSPLPELPVRRPYIQINVSFFFFTLIDVLYVGVEGNVTWQYADDPGTEECVERLSRSIPFSGNTTGCDASAPPTCDIVFVPAA